MNLVCFFILWCVIIMLVISLFVWMFIQKSRHSWIVLKPNQSYAALKNKYTFPNIVCVEPMYLLQDKYMMYARTTLILTSRLLAKFKIEWFLTKGALIGAVRHQTIPLPFDDYVAIAIDTKHRQLLFSQHFVDMAENYDIEVFYAKSASSAHARKFGACVRLQVPDFYCVLDIFFWTCNQESQMVAKLDGWSTLADVTILNPKEQFHFNDVYPIQQQVNIDNLVVNLPNKPQHILLKYYGRDVMEKCAARSLAVSHTCAAMMLKPLWTKKPSG